MNDLVKRLREKRVGVYSIFELHDEAADELERLQKERDELQAKCNAFQQNVWEIRDELAAAQQAEREMSVHCVTLQKDAERMRKAVVDLSVRGYGVRRPKWLVATIDAAMKEQTT